MSDRRDPPSSSPGVTQLLAQVAAGDAAASEQVVRAVYHELRQVAAAKLRRERSGHTLSSTALVHECYLRLMHSNPPLAAENRRHFFASAAEAMRRILIEHARRRAAAKNSGGRTRISLDSEIVDARESNVDVLALDEAIKALAGHDPLAARLVKLRYFGGLAHNEAAEQLGITRRQADRVWAIARVYLYRRLT